MNKEEFEKRFKENEKITGRDLDTTIHVPCPFCAAADLFQYKLLEMHKVLTKGAVCKECGRGVKALITHGHSSTHVELVQTVGDDPPEYAPFRRVEE